MFKGVVLCVPRSEALRYAGRYLSALGITVTQKCAPDVSHLLLPVPSFAGGDEYLAHYLTGLPDDIVISGGNLTSPLLEGYRSVDFLKDPYYLAENAGITASCAIEIVENKLETALAGCPVLIVGWGRIGKCLWHLLGKEGAEVTVAARKDADQAMIRALGSRSISIEDAALELTRYKVIINTVPVLVLPDMKTVPDAVILELASKPGMTGANIIDGRRLPGRMAPAASGRLIARTFMRLSLSKEV